jgi:hypothetical protein
MEKRKPHTINKIRIERKKSRKNSSKKSGRK